MGLRDWLMMLGGLESTLQQSNWPEEDIGNVFAAGMLLALAAIVRRAGRG